LFLMLQKINIIACPSKHFQLSILSEIEEGESPVQQFMVSINMDKLQ